MHIIYIHCIVIQRSTYKYYDIMVGIGQRFPTILYNLIFFNEMQRLQKKLERIIDMIWFILY